MEGKAGYIFGIGNLADYEVAASKGKKLACVSRVFVDEMKTKTVMQIIQEVDKYYQESPGNLGTPVIEVVLRQLTKASAGAGSGGGDEKMKRTVLVIMVAALLVGGCAGMSTTQQRTLSGGAIGASSGALIGWAQGARPAAPPSAGEPACWAGMLTTSMRNRKAGLEGISLILRVTSW